MRRLAAWYDDASLQTKFALQVVLSMTLLFAVLVPFVLYIQRQVLLSEVEDNGFRIADILARSSVQAVMADDYLIMQHVVNGISSERKVRYTMLLKEDGEVLVHTRAGERGQRYTDAASLAAARARGPLLQRYRDADGVHVYDFTVPVFVLDDKRASARVGLSIERELAEIARTRNSIVLLGLGVLGLGLVWATVQAKGVIRPVQAFLRGTREIARGNLDHRISLRARDELGQLADAFNRMTGSVQALMETSRELSSVLDPKTVLESIATYAQALVKADVAFIAPLDKATQEARVRVVLGARTDGIQDTVFTPGRGLGGSVLATGEALNSPDYLADARIVHEPAYDAVVRAESIVSVLVVPITLKGETVGLLWVANRQPRPFTDEDVSALSRMAHQAAIAMENARLYAETTLKTARLEGLIRVSQTITATLDPSRIVDVIARAMGDLMEGAVVRLWQAPTGRRGWAALAGPAGGAALDDAWRRLGTGLVERVAAARRPVVVEDLADDPAVARRPARGGEEFVSFLGLPLLREDALLGVLGVMTPARHRFSPDEIELFASFAQQAAIALENAHLYHDLKQSHEELSRAQNDLVRKTRMAAMGELAAAVAHEVRNPLGALTNCVQMLRRHSGLAEADAELLDIVHDETQRLNAIVSDFLAFGRPRPPAFSGVDLHGVIEEALGVLRRDDRCAPGIEFVTHLDGALPAVRADRDQLRQVFWNLFLNAVQAMGPRGTLAVETRRGDREAHVSVRDTGPGIGADALGKVFEPFYTTKAGGSGLGLPIVRRIVEDHGGRIAVDSQPEEGTCFLLSLALDTTAS
jgi:signal transduction histidine kinase